MDGPADELLEEGAQVSSSSSQTQAATVPPHTVTADRRIMDTLIYNRLKATQVSKLDLVVSFHVYKFSKI